VATGRGANGHLAHGNRIDFREANGFESERLSELKAPTDATKRGFYDYVTPDWAWRSPARRFGSRASRAARPGSIPQPRCLANRAAPIVAAGTSRRSPSRTSCVAGTAGALIVVSGRALTTSVSESPHSEPTIMPQTV
jgi:hypothetical protein